MMEIVLRFVTSDSIVSRLIRAQAGVSMPFTPTHVEALSRDGEAWIGMHLDGGCKARPLEYDKDEPKVQQAFVRLDLWPYGHDMFHKYIESKIGLPYDWKAIFSFVDPLWNLHDGGHEICSAFMTLALRECGYFEWPLTVPAHHVSPRDLFLMLSARVEIPH